MFLWVECFLIDPDCEQLAGLRIDALDETSHSVTGDRTHLHPDGRYNGGQVGHRQIYPMGLIDTTAEFVKRLNALVRDLDVRDENAMAQVDVLKRRIAAIRDRLSGAEARAIVLIDKLCTPPKEDTDTIFVRKDGMLKAIISESIQKPQVEPVKKADHGCNCSHSHMGHFSEPSQYMYIDTEAQLLEVDAAFVQVCLLVLDHDYRSFAGFCCYLAVCTPEGMLYMIDAIKLRTTIPRLRLLRCGVQKLVHCRRCVERLTADFGRMGCYRNYDAAEKDVFVDWRIRPLNETFVGIASECIREVVEKSNMQITSEKYEASPRNELAEYCERYQLPSDCPFLADLLKLRAYLAETYDEGVQYVMTDGQLHAVLESMPTTIAEFDAAFVRMSSVARLHAGDFLLILKKRAKAFSMERLKIKTADGEKEAIEECPKYRSFNQPVPVKEESIDFEESLDS